MKGIDKLFKDKLANNGLEYTDAHWAGMESLINQNKKVAWYANRKLVSVLLVVASISAIGIWWMSQEKASSSQTQAIVETPPVHNNTEAQNVDPVAIIDSVSVETPHTFELKPLPDFSNYIDYSPSCAGVIYQNDYPFSSPNTALAYSSETNIHSIDAN